MNTAPHRLKRLLHLLPVGMVLALLASPLHAASLTLDQALSLAKQNSPLLQAAKAGLEASQAAARTASAYPNPELEIMGGQIRPRQSQNGAETTRIDTATLSQPLELPNVRAARKQVAAAGIGIGQSQYDQTRLNLISQIRLAFFDAVRWEEASRVIGENRELLQQMRDRVKLKVNVGEAPRYELIKAEAETLAANNALKNAELRTRQAKTLLRSLIGAPLPDTLQLEHRETTPTQPPSLAELQQELLQNHPQLHLAQAQTEQALARVDYERSQRLPQPTLKLNQERTRDSNQWMVGIALPLPLWNQRSGPIGEAVAGLHQTEAQAQQTRLTLTAELEQAYSRYEIASSQVNTFETGLLQEAEAAMKVAEAAYRYGERSILDYIDAQRVLRSTQLEFLNARYELQAALVELERLRATPAGDPS